MIQGRRISYYEVGEEKRNETITLFLHGWGSNKESFLSFFSLRNKSIALDFPAFGKSVSLEKVFTLHDYAVFLKDFIEKVIQEKKKSTNTNLPSVEFVVHSFGGRVLLKYLENCKETISYNIQSIICMGVPFYRTLTLFQKTQLRVSQFLEKKKYTRFIKRIISSFYRVFFHNTNSDYSVLDGEIMKKTFQNIVNEDISAYLEVLKPYESNMKCIWGENDMVTPVSYAQNIQKMYPKIELCIIPNAGHFPWIDNFDAVKKHF